MSAEDWKIGIKDNDGSGGLIKRLVIVVVTLFSFLLLSVIAGGGLSSVFVLGSRSYYLSQSVCQCLIGFIGGGVAAAYWISNRPWRFMGIDCSGGFMPYVGVVIVYIISIPFMNQLIWYNEHFHLPSSMGEIEFWMRDMESASARLTEVILSTTSVGGLISGVIIVGILTGLSEELLFRGVLQRSITAYSPLRHAGIWLAAFIFSAMHMQFFGFFPRLLMGAFFGYVLSSTGSLWPAVFAHALNNSMIVILTWLNDTSDGALEGFEEWGVAYSGFPVAATVSLILLSAFFIFFYKKFFHS